MLEFFESSKWSDEMENDIMVPFVWNKVGAESFQDASPQQKQRFNELMWQKPGYKSFMENFDIQVNDPFSGIKFKGKEEKLRFKEVKFNEFQQALKRFSEGSYDINFKKIKEKIEKLTKELVEKAPEEFFTFEIYR